MTVSELITTVEQAGGHFTLDTSDTNLVYVRGELGSAPASLLPLLEREKARVADFLLLRLFLEHWQPREGVRLQ